MTRGVSRVGAEVADMPPICPIPPGTKEDRRPAAGWDHSRLSVVLPLIWNCPETAGIHETRPEKVRKSSLTCISDHYATAESVWSSISRHSGEGTSAPEAPETRCCHICNRNAPSMSLNVGVTLCRYHERCRSTCAPA